MGRVKPAQRPVCFECAFPPMSLWLHCGLLGQSGQNTVPATVTALIDATIYFFAVCPSLSLLPGVHTLDV